MKASRVLNAIWILVFCGACRTRITRLDAENLFDSCFDPVCHDQLYPAKPYAERHEEIEAMFKDIKLPIK